MPDLHTSSKKSAIKVLHVDDDSSILELSKLILLDLNENFEIDKACCVDEALRKLKVGHYDVVISDYEIPEKDGLLFLKELREQKSDIPFMLFTGKGREEVAMKALNLGADGYHNKQGSPETVFGELSHSINLAIERRKSTRALEEANETLAAIGREEIDGLVISSPSGTQVYTLNGAEKPYRTLIEQMNEGAVLLSGDNVVLFCNCSFAKILQYPLEKIAGRNIQDVISATNKDTFMKLISLAKEKKNGTRSEFTFHTKDDIFIPTQMSVQCLKVGNVSYTFILVDNVTERLTYTKRIELMNEKLLVMGSLTRHDVGNKLMLAKSYLYLLKKQIGDNPKVAICLEGIDSAIMQSDKMFEFSRFYEKIGVEKPSKTNVFESFNQAVSLLPNLNNVRLLNDCQGLEVTADSLLKQLFYNFLDNSLKHGEKVTQIRLHFTKDEMGVKLFYEDNGIGISEVNKPKLFHEGFTTGKSTGFGLFLIKKMVEVYGWTITENGIPNEGAKFVLTIPKIKPRES